MVALQPVEKQTASWKVRKLKELRISTSTSPELAVGFRSWREGMRAPRSYLTVQTIPTSDNPQQYWRAHATQFPSLAVTATKFLCAPYTSVDNKRLLSAVSNVIDEKRSQVSPNTANTPIFLKRTFTSFLSETNSLYE